MVKFQHFILIVINSCYLYTVVFCLFSVTVQNFHEEPLTAHNRQDDLEEGSVKSVTSSEDGNDSLEEQTLDVQMDMLERLGTAEQARNVDLFEQLRAWQAEQRDQLIRQQQQQLIQLQAKQQAAESRLLVQRRNVWNSSKNSPSSPTISNLPPKSAQRKVPVGLPHAIASSTLALARLQLRESVISDLDGPTQSQKNEQLLSNVSTTPVPPGEQQLNGSVIVSAANFAPDLQSENNGLHTLPNSVSDPASQHNESGDNRDILQTDVMLSSVPSDEEAVHKPESGMSVSEFDEVPVGAGAAQGKSFEELVLEQLVKEQISASESQQTPVRSAVPDMKRSKCFLKKGDGTARFKTSQRQFYLRKVTKASNNVKQSTLPETRLLPSTSSLVKPLLDPVLQPVSKKSCLKRKTVQNEDVAPLLDFVADNVACTNTPVTSTPDHKRLQTSIESVAFRQLAESNGAHGRDSVGDSSYVACMQARAEKDMAEVEELQEFELLEHYVDDNASFTSNTSTISQILAKQPSKFYEVKQNDSSHAKCSLVSNGVSVTGDHGKEEVYTNKYSMNSSDEDEDNCDKDVDDDDSNTTLVDDAPVLSTATGIVSVDSTTHPTALQTIYRKISSMNGRHFVNETQPVDTIHQQLLSSGGNDRLVSHLQSGLVEDKFLSSAVVQPRHESVEVQFEENGRVGHDTTEKVHKHMVDANIYEGTAVNNLFSDEREWNDSLASSPIHAETNLQRNSVSPNCAASASSSEAQLSVETGYHTSDAQTDSPPTSKLAQKLFPRLKQNKRKPTELGSASRSHNGVSTVHAEGTTDTAPAVASATLREKLAQLEMEIQQFRSENAVLATLRKEREQVVNQLKKEMAEFERQKADELQRLEEFKAEEIKKLKKERKVFETYQKAARSGPDRKDREEIENLKSQLCELQDEMKRKEQKWTASNQRLRDRVEQVEQENTELREEIRVLENRRLQDWKPRRNEQVPAAKSDAKPLESARTGQNTAPRSSQQVVEKSQVYAERQKHVPNSKIAKPCQVYKSPVYSSSNSDTQPAAETKLSLDISDETLQQRNNVPKPQTISPLPVSASISGDDTKSLAAVRKTAPKTGVVASTDVGDRSYDQVQHADGKVERVCPDGSREIVFTNGTRKQISSDGQTIIVSFFNGDIKQILPDGRVVYYYVDARTTHTTYADGLQIFQFCNGQVEKHYIDGTKEIQFPDQTIKYLFLDGSAESVFLDGTVVHVESNGNKQITFPNGQKELHTALFKKREYPDGTTKTVFTDGRQETKYSNGRVRIKDAGGVVVLDQLA